MVKYYYSILFLLFFIYYNVFYLLCIIYNNELKKLLEPKKIDNNEFIFDINI